MIKMIRMLIVLAVVLVALPAYGATFNLSQRYIRAEGKGL